MIPPDRSVKNFARHLTRDTGSLHGHRPRPELQQALALNAADPELVELGTGVNVGLAFIV